VSDKELNCISSDGLRKLAAEAERCGVPKYAEAYRLVADRLDALGPKLNNINPEDLWPPKE